MSNEENPGQQHGQPDPYGGWRPTPQGGEYDAEATAFVHLPPEDLANLGGDPLAAPGHGYVPPMILPLTPAAGLDPAATGSWVVQTQSQQERAGQAAGPEGAPEAVHWPDPNSAHETYQQYRPDTSQYGQTSSTTAQWHFPEAEAPAPAPEPVPEPLGHTGQWTIPVADGELPEESGEYAASAMASQWYADTPPATLPGGAPAPWATPEPMPDTEPAAAPEPAATPDAPSAASVPGPASPPEPEDPQTAGAPVGGVPAAGVPVGGVPAAGEAPGEAHDGTPGHAPDAPESPEQSDVRGAQDAAAHADAEYAEHAGYATYAEHATHAEQEGADGSEETPEPPEAPEPPGDAETLPAGTDPFADAADAALPGEDGPDAEHATASADPAVDVTDATAAADAIDPTDATGATDAASGRAPAAEPEPGHAPAPVPMDGPSEHPAASYVLHVNGVDRPVSDAWIGESLLYVLRERLGLAGAKDGCSQGECGACNVQVDGRLVASCLVPAATTAGSEVRTVEGLAVDGEPSDVQRALAGCGAVQCGFCIPGMAMTVHDLLEGNHAPTELETRQALCGNLCRCSGYRGVLDAVREVVAGREATAEAAATADEEPRIPHQAAPGAGGVQIHPHEGDAR
ncbi:2Fe-2S iron-sulfur cluster-binding protein [Streptomyces griseus]|uniref:2Fe-2S iron-sulfur cluster-binding protein n=1 Tax=Streptomyces griseus TaxID=1911 RepID=UPI0008403DAE|nr:2Fe-2S iron-sulfur cluster-binding protein [Streptomyces griseus]